MPAGRLTSVLLPRITEDVMKNPFILLLIVIGVGLAGLAAFVVLQPGEAPSSPSSAEQATSSTDVGQQDALIPDSLPGFEAQSIERAEPSFEGELFSVHAQFAPTAESPYADAVESLGVSVFRLSNPDAGAEIKDILAMGEPETRTVAERDIQVFVNDGAGLAGALWQQGVDVYLVLASGTSGDDQARQRAQEAVRSAAEALLGGPN